MAGRRSALAAVLVTAVALAACRAAVPATVSPSVPAATPTVVPSPPGFGDIGALRDALASAGFEAGVSPQGWVTLSSGPSVVVTLTPDISNLGEFREISLEVAPLSALDDDPTARPAVDVVLELFDWWSPEAADRARRSLRDVGSTTSREGAAEHQERREADTADGFRLVTEFSYGGDSADDDYFRAALSRR
jgi:hypothetical protein